MTAGPPALVSSDERVLRARELLGARAVVDEPIGRRTTYRVGGRAALFTIIEDERSLAATVAAVGESGVDVLVLGNGSNLLVADAGYPGLVVMLGGVFGATATDAREGTVVAGAAVAYPVLARQSAAAGLTGMEWSVGIPGSVGGAVRMNAGGHGSSTGERLVRAHVVNLASGAHRRVTRSGLGLGYRRSNIAPSELVLEATFACEPQDPAIVAETISSIVRWRRENQPGGRNAGSVFTNPPGDSAGRLIESVGLKGCRIGTAEMSHKHANFIQADADGSADDVVRLLEHVRDVVAAKTGVVLETELRIVGTPS